ncbi:hypothetical protein F0562_034379 [Nyssa sinensis]|uniref:Uncharacterized protein n=1 Tax=Nyssa sinensis TaxID=561372 RepID=A0A5J5AJ22_9ASTE|nr:hypothetical protein F0562_034379 [Nyssa sinensis]
MDSREFSVEVMRKEIVSAVLPVQEQWLAQSNLDLLLPPEDVGVFFCYKKPTGSSFGSMVGLLKKAMAQVLVSYYAFAGEFVQNSVGEPVLLCNNRGVDFLEAFADVELQHINLYNPDESIQGKLLPEKKEGVLSAQAYFGFGLEIPACLLVTIGWRLVVGGEGSVMRGLGIGVVCGWVGSVMIGGGMRIFGVGVMDGGGTLGGFWVGGFGGGMDVFGEPVEANGIWGKGSVTISSGELKSGEAVSAERVSVVS